MQVIKQVISLLKATSSAHHPSVSRVAVAQCPDPRAQAAQRPSWGYHHDLPESSMEPPCSPPKKWVKSCKVQVVRY